MLNKLLREMKKDEAPTHLAVIFDKSERTFRSRIYPEYKANRSAPPDDLIPQFGLIRIATRAFSVPCIEQSDFEADDLIATYARQAAAKGARVRIVSSDKDLMQLVNDRIRLYDTMKDRDIGEAEVIEKFGVAPDKVIDVQALAGDSIDNVPGVPGIGVKTGAKLITEFGSLEELLARAAEIKQPKMPREPDPVRRPGSPLQAAGDAQGRRGSRGDARSVRGRFARRQACSSVS